MHTPEQQELLAKVEQLKREKKYSQNEVAKVIGISGTSLSQVKNENYPADPQSIFDIIANYFGVKEKAKLTYTEIDYAPTSISTKIYDIINVCQVKGGLAAAAGDAGIGKTKAAQKFVKDHPTNSILITVNSCFTSIKSLLKIIAERIGASAERSRDELWFSIVKKLSDGMVLIFDEAQHLTLKNIEVLRSFSDYFNDKGQTLLKDLFKGYDLTPFLNPEADPVERYRLLAKAAEYVFYSTQELSLEQKSAKNKVSFKTYFLKTVKRMRTAYNICQPSGNLSDEESALAQCFMAIAGFVRKMSGTSDVDAETMNRNVAKMVEDALKYNKVESILDEGEQEDIFSPEYFERLTDVKMPASKLELLVKMLRKQIKEYNKTNRAAAKKYEEMLEETIRFYHERRKNLSAEEAGETQEQASDEIIQTATEQALKILKEMQTDRKSFRKMGLTFEEKAFYDILLALRDKFNFEYGDDKPVDGIIVNERCKVLAKKIKELIDVKSSFADWLNNQNVRNNLKYEIKVCLIKNGLTSARVRLSGGHLCEAEAPPATTVDTRKATAYCRIVIFFNAAIGKICRKDVRNVLYGQVLSKNRTALNILYINRKRNQKG